MAGPGEYAWHFVGYHRHSQAGTTNQNAPLKLLRRHPLRQVVPNIGVIDLTLAEKVQVYRVNSQVAQVIKQHLLQR